MNPFFYKILLALGGLLALGALALGYLVWFGPEARASQRNLHNSYRIQPGMSATQARRIMGPPDRHSATPEGELICEYNAGFADSEIYFSLNADSNVVRVGHGNQ
jgi:hypothetical protein